MRIAALLIISLTTAACSSDNIDSDEEARRAYFGLDTSIGKSLTLGFAGFNAAQSANIDPQMMVGDGAGTLTITGQVDQGASANKGMRLHVGMVAYSDGVVTIHQEGKDDVKVHITYDTVADPAMQPYLELSLKGIPTGTFTGALTGTYSMHGDIEGDATLNLMFSGTLMSNGAGGTTRVPLNTTVMGTAVSGDGTFDVNLKI